MNETATTEEEGEEHAENVMDRSSSSSPPPPPPSDHGCDVVIANPWGPSSFRMPPAASARPPSPSMLCPLPILISPTCPQHGLLLHQESTESNKMSAGRRCSALLDGLPADGTTMKMVFTLGLCKLFCGIVVFLLGVAALPFQATLSSTGIGLWAGMVTLVSGVAGLLSSKLPRNYAVLVAFLCWSISSLATSSLLLIFSATGLTKDLVTSSQQHHHLHRMSHNASTFQYELFDDFTTNSSVTILQSVTSNPDNSSSSSDFDKNLSFLALFQTKRPAIVVNTSLVILAVVDCLVSVMSITLASSETCTCCSSTTATRHGGNNNNTRMWSSVSERKIRHDRLVGWIQQQRLRLLMQPPPLTFGNYCGYNTPHSSSSHSRRRCRVVEAEPSSSHDPVSIPGHSLNSCISVDSLAKKSLQQPQLIPTPTAADDRSASEVVVVQELPPPLDPATSALVQEIEQPPVVYHQEEKKEEKPVDDESPDCNGEHVID